jgi:hypothetical protein
LRCIFLAEEGLIRFGGDEEFADYSGDTAKVAWAGMAIEAIAQAGHFDECRDWSVGIKLFDRGDEDNVRAFSFRDCAVGIEGAWVAREIFVGTELSGIDEDAYGDLMARSGGSSNQGCVAGVQRAHGGNEA